MNELREVLDRVVGDVEKDGAGGDAGGQGTPPADNGGGDRAGQATAFGGAAKEPISKDRQPDPEAAGTSGNLKEKSDGQEEEGRRQEVLTPAPGDKNVPPAQPSTPQPTGQPVATLKPPASLKPEARAVWEKAPPELQAEFHRREREVNEALRASTESRRFYQEFQQTIAPYEAIIRSEGSDPLRAVDNLMKTAVALRTAPAPVKAKMVADIVSQFGVDIRMLDSALSGTLPPPTPPDPYVQQLQQELAPLKEFVSSLQAHRQTLEQRTQAEVQSELEQFFADEENYPYANDLRDDIADILEVAARRGVQMSLQDAYSRASMLHPTISKLVENRGVAQQVAQQNAAAQKARNTAVSVKSAPAGSGGTEDENDDSIRGAIYSAIGKVGGRV